MPLVTLHSGAHAVPSARAPSVELTAGLTAHSQSGWPSVRFDLGRILDASAPLWAAGFYNKTFMWPSWHIYEGIVRRMAGLGRAPAAPDPDRYEVRNAHCDVLIVGGGEAGLKAATEAGLRGERVILAEQQPVLGGHRRWNNPTGNLTPQSSELRRLPNLTILLKTTAVGAYDHQVYTLVENTSERRRLDRAGPVTVRERLWVVRAKSVVLVTGNIEQPLVFTHNDRPGILLAALPGSMRCGTALRRVAECSSRLTMTRCIESRRI